MMDSILFQSSGVEADDYDISQNISWFFKHIFLLNDFNLPRDDEDFIPNENCEAHTDFKSMRLASSKI